MWVSNEGAHEWTGHAVLMGNRSYAAQDTDSVLSLFANDRGTARNAYRLSVADRLASPRPVDLEGGGLKRSLGCWESRPQLKRSRERWAADERILGDSDFVNRMLVEIEAREPSLVRVHAADVVPQLCTLVGTQFGIGAPVVMSRSCLPAAVAARAIVSWLAVARLGAIPAQVARALGVSVPSVLRGVSRAPTRA